MTRLSPEREAEIREYHARICRDVSCRMMALLDEIDSLREDNRALREALQEILMDEDCHCTTCDIARAALERKP